MCGLYGVASFSLGLHEKEHFQMLASVSVLRGRHSTGVAACIRQAKQWKELEFDYLKAEDHAVDFYGNPCKKTVNMFDESVVCLMGHNRHATVGDLSLENAHPFETRRYIGMHNGTIDALSPKKGKRSDSWHLMRTITQRGIKETLGALPSSISSAYALSLFDKEEMTLNLCRNDMRPLWIMYNKAKNTMYWASERAFLVLLSSRYHGSFEIPEAIEAHHLYSFNLGVSPGHKNDCVPLRRPVVVRPSYGPDTNPPLAPAAAGSVNNVTRIPVVHKDDEYHHAAAVQRALQYSRDRQRQKQIDLFKPTRIEKKQGVVLIRYLGYQGRIMKLKHATKILKGGCDNCGQVCEHGDEVNWVTATNYICHECINTKIVKDYISMYSEVTPSKLILDGEV